MSERLIAKGLVKSYRGRRVVDDVHVEVGLGEVVGLLGPNGAGKTTTFNMVVGLVPAEAGTVSLAGLDLTRLPIHKRARAGLGYLPQEASIFRRLSLRQNFLAVLELDKSNTKAEREAAAQALLEEFHLTEVAESLGEQLSGGERRRAEIARSLIRKPRFMLFDEPFAGVDPINVIDIQRQIAALQAGAWASSLPTTTSATPCAFATAPTSSPTEGCSSTGRPERLPAPPTPAPST